MPDVMTKWEGASIFIFILLITLGCSNQGGSATADTPTSNSAVTQQRVQEVEAKVQRLESRLQSTRQLLLVAASLGAVLLTIVGLLLWKRGSNRRDQIRKIKRGLKTIADQKGGSRKRSSHGVQWKRSGSASHQQNKSEVVSELEQRVAKLEGQITSLQKTMENAPREIGGSTISEEQEEERSSSVTKERSGSASSPAASDEESSMTASENQESRPERTRDPRPTSDSVQKQQLDRQEPRSKEDSHSDARELDSSRAQMSGTGSGAMEEGVSGERDQDESIVDDFNRFLRDQLSKTEFRERYDPIRIGIENEEERLDSAEAPVILQEDERGQYLAVEREDYYLVLPKYNLILDESVRRQAGFDEVFQCSEIPHEHPYRIHRLDRAAQFVPERHGRFALEAPGEAALKRYG